MNQKHHRAPPEISIADRFENLLDLLLWVRDESQARVQAGTKFGIPYNEILGEGVECYSLNKTYLHKFISALYQSGFLQKITVGHKTFYLVPEDDRSESMPETQPAQKTKTTSHGHQCPYCDKTTPTKTGLTHHIVRMHKGESLLSRDLQHAAKSGKGVNALKGLR